MSYKPNSLDPSGLRDNTQRGFRTFAAQEGEGETGQKLRLRPESFADHYSQARQFYRSMSAPEQRHIQKAFAFELSKVETPVIRSRMLGHLALVEETLATWGRDCDRYGRRASGNHTLSSAGSSRSISCALDCG